MYRRHHRKARLLFALSDIVIITIAFEAAYQTRVFLPLDNLFYLPVPIKALLLGATLLSWLVYGFWMNIYERLDSAHLRVILRDTFRQCALGAITIIFLQFALRLNLSRPFLLLLTVYSWFLMFLFRWHAGSIVGLIRREFGAAHYVMVIGTGDRARGIGRLLEQSEMYGVRLLGFLSEKADEAGGVIHLRMPHPVHGLRDLPRLLRNQVIDEVIFAVETEQLPRLEDTFLLCDEEGVSARVAVDFFPHVNSDVSLERLGDAPLLAFTAAPSDEIRLFLKRGIDVILASFALLIILPVMAAIALLIKITSPGPAIFRQVRCGLNGRRFIFYKFRSMCANAEAMKAQYTHLNRKQTAFKIPGDPRLTPVGKYIRKFSIDEWPQLWNVIKGDMSLVGPRPAVPEEVEQYMGWQRRRLRMRPGLTCLWAISGRDNLDFETWMKLDMQYIDHWSLALDWKIILRTIPHVLMGKGAH